ncbi:uncharacterized protein EV420DRAFT_1748899, partial [Desarmillaria tabescens]
MGAYKPNCHFEFPDPQHDFQASTTQKRRHRKGDAETAAPCPPVIGAISPSKHCRWYWALVVASACSLVPPYAVTPSRARLIWTVAWYAILMNGSLAWNTQRWEWPVPLQWPANHAMDACYRERAAEYDSVCSSDRELDPDSSTAMLGPTIKVYIEWGKRVRNDVKAEERGEGEPFVHVALFVSLSFGAKLGSCKFPEDDVALCQLPVLTRNGRYVAWRPRGIALFSPVSDLLGDNGVMSAWGGQRKLLIKRRGESFQSHQCMEDVRLKTMHQFWERAAVGGFMSGRSCGET